MLVQAFLKSKFSLTWIRLDRLLRTTFSAKKVMTSFANQSTKEIKDYYFSLF